MFSFDPDVEHFRTSDIMLAALLNHLYGVTMMEKDTNNRFPNVRYVFVFQNSEALHNTLLDWNTYKVRVEPRKYYASVKQLKSMGEMYSRP